jgi:hypothetical protein
MQSRKLSLAACGLGLVAAAAHAADHTDAPGTKAAHGDLRADITDVFVFMAPNHKLVGTIDFAGTPDPNAREDGPTATYGLDADLIYQFHISYDGATPIKSNIDVNVRFAQDPQGNWGVQFENVPGVKSKTIAGAFNTVFSDKDSGLRFYAGVKDDPFFFDFVGFNAVEASFGDGKTRGQGNALLFNNARDSFGMRNVTAIVFEMDPTAATQSHNQIRVWATSARRS